MSRVMAVRYARDKIRRHVTESSKNIIIPKHGKDIGMEVKEKIREKYGEAALRVRTGGSTCCGASANLDGCCVDPITSNLYDAGQTGQIPEEAVLASLGCGNPTALAKLNAGKSSSISAPEAASTCCFPRSASGRPARPMAWT